MRKEASRKPKAEAMSQRNGKALPRLPMRGPNWCIQAANNWNIHLPFCVELIGKISGLRIVCVVKNEAEDPGKVDHEKNFSIECLRCNGAGNSQAQMMEATKRQGRWTIVSATMVALLHFIQQCNITVLCTALTADSQGKGWVFWGLRGPRGVVLVGS